MPRPTITRLTAAHLDDAAVLLAARHRAHREAQPLLAPRFEDPAAARAELDALWERDGASGAAASAGGQLTGFLLGTPREHPAWGPNAWVEPAGHAALRAEDVRDLYALAAARWTDEGRTHHYAVVPATDDALVDAWFRLGFGQQHAHALREPPGADTPSELPDGLTIRRAEREDVAGLAELDLVLRHHHALAPVYSTLTPPTLSEAAAEWEKDIGDPANGAFSAVSDGAVVGAALGCPVGLSSVHAGMARPDGASELGLAIVLPHARGLGVGRALGEAVLAWSAAAGYRTVAVDWRVTNLLASRAWPRLGFRPSFLRLFRPIA